MKYTFHYRLSQTQKEEIAQNLIDILSKKAMITDSTRSFISNWILTGPEEKYKAYYDVWDIVLKNYLPQSRPILFRTCRKRYNGRIASFTGSLESARRFSKEKGLLIICDTKESLQFETRLYKPGEYQHTFYPLFKVLGIARNHGGWGFSDKLLNEYIGEQEYIMRVDLDYMHSFKWIKNDLYM